MDSPRTTTTVDTQGEALTRSSAADAAATREAPALELDPGDLKNPALYINRELS
jgi:hypothetical protein